MQGDSEKLPFEKLNGEGYTRQEYVAQDMVDGGQCSNYTEAYEVIRSMKSGDVIRTYRGWIKKQ